MLKRKNILCALMALMLVIAYSQTPVFANDNSDEVGSHQEYDTNIGDEEEASVDLQEKESDETSVESSETVVGQETTGETPELMNGASSKPETLEESGDVTVKATGTDNADSDEPNNIVASGECGSNLSWELNDLGVLCIKGNGNMSNWSSTSSPFYSRKSSITSVVIEEGVTSIGNYAFNGCSSITAVDLPDGLTAIGGNAFSGCSSLSSLDFPSSLQSFGSYAFKGCKFGTIVIPENVKSLTRNVFTDCSFDYVYIPRTVETIKGATLNTFFPSSPKYEHGSEAFYNCKGKCIAYIEPNGGLSGWESYWSYGLSSVKYGFSYEAFLYNLEPLSNDEEIVVPDGVNKVDGKFTGLTGIRRVVLPEGFKAIAASEFKGCTNLEEVILPSTLKSIGESAFYNCYSLKSINIPEGVTSIGKYAFGYCNSLETIAYPESYTYMGQKALYHCSKLKSIYLYNVSCDTTFTKYGGGSEVDYYPIYGWNGPLKIFMYASESPSLETLARYLKWDKPNLEIIPCSSRKFYDYYLSLDKDITMATIPSNLGEINIDAFSGFSELESMSIDMTGNTITANNSGNSLTNLKTLHVKVTEGGSLNISSNLLNRLERLWISSSEESFKEAYPEQYELVKDKAVFGVEEITDIQSAMFDTIEPVKYNGADNPIEFPPLMYNDRQLEIGKDYELTYSVDDTNHTINLVITGQGSYYGTKEFSIEYTRPDASEVTVSNIPDQSYTGRRITPVIVVRLNENVLSLGKDYTLSFKNNTEVGEATAIIELSNAFTGNRTITKSFSIIENTELNSEDTGYMLVVNAGKRTLARHMEGQKVTIVDMNEVAYKTFQRWEVVSGDLSIPASQASNRTLSITMPATDVSIQAVYSGQSLQDEIAAENNRYNAIVFRASTLDANIELYSGTANRIKSKYGVSYLQSSTYYNSQATSTQTEITKKQNRLASLKADTAGGHQVEIKQLEAEIKELQSDYQMYLELKSAAQYQEKADAAQKERNKINLTTEKKTHDNNISNICKKHGVKDTSVKEISIIRLDKNEYTYSGKEIRPAVTVIDSDGKKLGNESYDVIYPTDCISEGEHIITLKLKGKYVGQKTRAFNIVKHKYGSWLITVKPTCTKKGERKRVCSECGRVEVEAVPAAHKYGEWKTVKKSTELVTGKQTRKCAVCGKTEARVVALLKPSLPTVKGVKVTASKKITTIKWKKISKTNLKKIKKIQIQYSTDKQFKKAVKTKNVNAKKKTVYKIKGLKKGKKYYVRVRSYSKSGGTVHISKWVTKSFKAK